MSMEKEKQKEATEDVSKEKHQFQVVKIPEKEQTQIWKVLKAEASEWLLDDVLFLISEFARVTPFSTELYSTALSSDSGSAASPVLGCFFDPAHQRLLTLRDECCGHGECEFLNLAYSFERPTTKQKKKDEANQRPEEREEQDAKKKEEEKEDQEEGAGEKEEEPCFQKRSRLGRTIEKTLHWFDGGDIQFDATGDILLISRKTKHSIQAFSISRDRPLYKLGSLKDHCSSQQAEFDCPGLLVTQRHDNTFYVHDEGNHRIQHFSVFNGEFLREWKWSSNNWNSAFSSFNWFQGMVVHQQCLYLCSRERVGVLELDSPHSKKRAAKKDKTRNQKTNKKTKKKRSEDEQEGTTSEWKCVWEAPGSGVSKETIWSMTLTSDGEWLVLLLSKSRVTMVHTTHRVFPEDRSKKHSNIRTILTSDTDKLTTELRKLGIRSTLEQVVCLPWITYFTTKNEIAAIDNNTLFFSYMAQ